jgi:hypothetical protein
MTTTIATIKRRSRSEVFPSSPPDVLCEFTVNVTVWDALIWCTSVTVTMIVNVPVTVGVQAMVDAFTVVQPSGRFE